MIGYFLSRPSITLHFRVYTLRVYIFVTYFVFVFYFRKDLLLALLLPLYLVPSICFGYLITLIKFLSFFIYFFWKVLNTLCYQICWPWGMDPQIPRLDLDPPRSVVDLGRWIHRSPNWICICLNHLKIHFINVSCANRNGSLHYKTHRKIHLQILQFWVF